MEYSDKAFELRDSIMKLDNATDYMFDLTGLYDSSEFDESEIKLIANLIAGDEDAQKKAEDLFDILNAKNVVNFDEDCEQRREYKEVFHPSYEDLQNGDEIIAGGQHLYVVDAEYDDDYVWVTDEKEDRYNKRAPGNTLAKYLIDEVIGQPDNDDDLDEHLESLTEQFYFDSIDKYKEMAGLAKQLGLKTVADLEKFMKEQGEGKDPITALRDYLENDIGDINFQAKDESLKTNINEDVNMTRKEMIDWIEDHWNTAENSDYLYKVLSDMGFDVEDDSDEDEGFYATLSNSDLERVIDNLKDETELSVFDQVGSIKKALQTVGSVEEVTMDYGSDEATYDVSVPEGNTFRIQIYKM